MKRLENWTGSSLTYKSMISPPDSLMTYPGHGGQFNAVSRALHQQLATTIVSAFKVCSVHKEEV